MINLESLEKTIDNFAYQKCFLRMKILPTFLTGKKSPQDSMTFLTRAYYQRQNLVKEGFIGVCYTVRVAYSEGKDKKSCDLSTFCPQQSFNGRRKVFRKNHQKH